MNQSIKPVKIKDYLWEIPKHGNMKVSARLFMSKVLLENIKTDNTLIQAKNVACLKGIQNHSFVMPDGHQGYGFPIGGVAAFDIKEGIISPGGVGYDINCGVRLMKTEFTLNEIMDKREKLLNLIYNKVPAGVGKGGLSRLDKDDLKKICQNGAEWAVEQGFGLTDDLKRTEESGKMPGADFNCLSQRAIERGLPQAGTLGAGNHFIELQTVEKIFDHKVAEVFGIKFPGQILVMIHCGSRGFGHQIASDYIRQMENAPGIKDLPDRQLVNAPVQSELGRRYFKAMTAAVNFAFTNRQMIAHLVRNAFNQIVGTADGIDQIYDVCHNIAKMEKHEINGETKKVCIHRKGATRSFGPGREEIPECYRKVGQPVIIPGSMGTASYILVGTKQAEKMSFASTAHGAGRVMSRHEARKRFRGECIKSEMEKRGTLLKCAGWRGVSEEAAAAYKDVDEVVDISQKAGIGQLVAKVIPVGVIKG